MLESKLEVKPWSGGKTGDTQNGHQVMQVLDSVEGKAKNARLLGGGKLRNVNESSVGEGVDRYNVTAREWPSSGNRSGSGKPKSQSESQSQKK